MTWLGCFAVQVEKVGMTPGMTGFCISRCISVSFPQFLSWSGRKEYISSRSVPLGRRWAVASIKALLNITWLGGLKARDFFVSLGSECSKSQADRIYIIKHHLAKTVVQPRIQSRLFVRIQHKAHWRGRHELVGFSRPGQIETGKQNIERSCRVFPSQLNVKS